MSTIDVHRLLDNSLPEGKKCEGVVMVEVYTATIDGQEIAAQFDPGTSPDDIAHFLVSLTVGAAADNAQAEGHEVEEGHEHASDHPSQSHGKHKQHKK